MRLSYETLLLWLASKLDELMIPGGGLDPIPSPRIAGSWDLLPWRLPCLRVRDRLLSVRELSCIEVEMVLVWMGRPAGWLLLRGLFWSSERTSGPLSLPCCSDVFSN